MVYKICATTKKTVYQDEDVLNGNIANFIYNFIGREEIVIMHWNYVSLHEP